MICANIHCVKSIKKREIRDAQKAVPAKIAKWGIFFFKVKVTKITKKKTRSDRDFKKWLKLLAGSPDVSSRRNNTSRKCKTSALSENGTKSKIEHPWTHSGLLGYRGTLTKGNLGFHSSSRQSPTHQPTVYCFRRYLGNPVAASHPNRPSPSAKQTAHKHSTTTN